MLEKPKFIPGLFAFQGKGLAMPRPLEGVTGEALLDVGFMEF